MRKFNVTFFTASCDDAETNQEFAKSLELDYPILSDPDRAVASKYGVVTKERRVPFRWTFFIGDDGKILHIEKDVDVGGHGAQVAKQLGKLGVAAAK